MRQHLFFDVDQRKKLKEQTIAEALGREKTR